MQSVVDINVLCIPWTFDTIGENLVRKTFDQLNLGVIDKVAFKRTTNSKGIDGNTIYVYFQRWYRNDSADAARSKLLQPKDNFITVNYHTKGYWRVFADTHKIHNPNISSGEKLYGPKFFSDPKDMKRYKVSTNKSEHVSKPQQTEGKKFTPQTPPNSPPISIRKTIQPQQTEINAQRAQSFLESQMKQEKPEVVRHLITSPPKPLRNPDLDAVNEHPEETAVYDAMTQSIKQSYANMQQQPHRKIKTKYTRPKKQFTLSDDSDDSDDETVEFIDSEDEDEDDEDLDQLYGDLHQLRLGSEDQFQ